MRQRAGDIAAWGAVLTFLGCFNCSVGPPMWFADATVVNETDGAARVALESGAAIRNTSERLSVDVAPGGSVEYAAVTDSEGIVRSQASTPALGRVALDRYWRYWPRRVRERDGKDRLGGCVRLREQDGALIARRDADAESAKEHTGGESPGAEPEMKEVGGSGTSSEGGGR